MQATTIGQRIKQKRKELHLTQADLAKKVQGVSHAAISQWETDITKPNAENLYRKFLNVILSGCCVEKGKI